jgi:hypothetical protein
MTLPSFTAEASLYNPINHYRTGMAQAHRGGGPMMMQRPAAPPASLVSPAWYTPYSCRWNEETGVIECEEERPM